MINETNIRCFLLLAETLSFTETARRVYLTQQAVSKSINNLESSLGFPLFDRSNRNITLTAEGNVCYDLFTEVERMYTDTINSLRAGYTMNHASLRVGYQNFLELGVELINANNMMCSEHREAQLMGVRHSPGQLSKLFSDGQLDLIISYGRYIAQSKDYNVLELMRVPAVVMVSPDNPNVSEDATYLDFKNEPYLVDMFENETIQDFDHRVKSELDMCGLTPSDIVVLPNRDSAYSAAELGGGILLGSDISLTSKGSRLIRFRTKYMESISCFWKKGEKNRLAGQYADCLRRAYGK